MVHALWHSIQSDKTQREMLRDAAAARPDLSPEFVENVEWAVKMAGELAIHRNEAVHTPVRFAPLHSGPVPIYQRVSGAQTGSREASGDSDRIHLAEGPWRSRYADRVLRGALSCAGSSRAACAIAEKAATASRSKRSSGRHSPCFVQRQISRQAARPAARIAEVILGFLAHA